MLSASSFEEKKIECTWRCWFTCPGKKKKKKEKNFHVYVYEYVYRVIPIFFLNFKFFLKSSQYLSIEN